MENIKETLEVLVSGNLIVYVLIAYFVGSIFDSTHNNELTKNSLNIVTKTLALIVFGGMLAFPLIMALLGIYVAISGKLIIGIAIIAFALITYKLMPH